MQKFVFIILEGVKIAIVHSQTFEQLTVDQNPFNSTVTGNPSAFCCIQEMSLLLVAFTSGNIGVLSLPQNQYNIYSSFQFEILYSADNKSTYLHSSVHPLDIKGYFVCMEEVTIDESTNELWCGCNNNTIVILESLKSLAPFVSYTIKNVSGSTHIPCKVLQLKMVNTLNLQFVCALLDVDVGIVVWYDAVSKNQIKKIALSTGKHVIHVANHSVFTITFS